MAEGDAGMAEGEAGMKEGARGYGGSVDTR